ncbi:hypothetical protein T265_12711, partial [Opisthorchis viverrini]
MWNEQAVDFKTILFQADDLFKDRIRPTRIPEAIDLFKIDRIHEGCSGQVIATGTAVLRTHELYKWNQLDMVNLVDSFNELMEDKLPFEFDVVPILRDRSAVASFRCLTAMLREGSTRAGILPGCPSLNKESREAEAVFEPRTVRHHCVHIQTILPYGSETWPLRAEDVTRLSVFDHRCLRSIARIWWEHRSSNAEVCRMVFGGNYSPSIDELITLHRLRWLGHVLRMPVD